MSGDYFQKEQNKKHPNVMLGCFMNIVCNINYNAATCFDNLDFKLLALFL
jgi:hypothetical protein